MLKTLSQIDRNDIKGRLFIATVVSNDDPQRLERIKVTIPRLLDTAADPSSLPWIGPLKGGPIANGPGHGSFGLVPRVGSKVWVEFQDGNPQFGQYWHSPILNGMRLAEADVNYPNRYGFKDPAGNLIYVDVTPGQNTMHVMHASGTAFTVNNDGSLTVLAVAAINSQAPEWNHTGDVNITGTVRVTTDVIAGSNDVSLIGHVHGGIDPGPSNTSPPV